MQPRAMLYHSLAVKYASSLKGLLGIVLLGHCDKLWISDVVINCYYIQESGYIFSYLTHSHRNNSYLVQYDLAITDSLCSVLFQRHVYLLI